MSCGHCRLPWLDAGRVRLFCGRVPGRQARDPVPRQQTANRLYHYSDAGDAAAGRDHFWIASGPLWAKAPADGKRHLLFSGRAAMRFLPELHGVFDLAHNLWDRDGRRVGRGCLADDGSCPGSVERDSVGHSAERIFNWISVGGAGGSVYRASVGLAGYVLGGWRPSVARPLHPGKRT